MLGASSTGASGRAVMGWFRREERGFALGIRQMALPLGGAAAAVVLPQVVDAGGLQAAFLTLAGALPHRRGRRRRVHARRARRPTARCPPSPAPPPTRDARLWRLGAAGALLVAAQACDARLRRALPARRARRLGRRLPPRRSPRCSSLGAGMRIVAGRRSDREGVRIAPIRRIAVRNFAFLAATAALVHAAGPAALPGADVRRRVDDELERPRVHRRGRDLGPRPRRDGHEPAEHDPRRAAARSRRRRSARWSRRRRGRARSRYSPSRRSSPCSSCARSRATRTSASPNANGVSPSYARWRCPDDRFNRSHRAARGPFRTGGRRRVRHDDRRARHARAAPCAIAASTSRTSSAPCRSRRSGACSSTARCCPGSRPPSRTRSPSARATRGSTSRRRWRCSRRNGACARSSTSATSRRATTSRARRSWRCRSSRSRRAARGRPPVPQREIDRGALDPRALPDPLARRGRPAPREGDRRLLDQRRRARDERLDVHGAGHRVDRRGRRRRALGRRRRAQRAAARRRAVARAARCSTRSSARATPAASSARSSTAASG